MVNQGCRVGMTWDEQDTLAKPCIDFHESLLLAFWISMKSSLDNGHLVLQMKAYSHWLPFHP